MKALKNSEKIFKNKVVIDFQRDKKLVILVNLFSVLSFPLFYSFFYYLSWLLGIIQRNDQLYYYFFFKFLPSKYLIIILVILFIITIVHELIHGLFFYLITKDKPVFGYKILYAYAGAPDWYIKKKYFFVIGLSPFVIITIAGIISLFLIGSYYLSVVLIPLAAHSAACVGDLWFNSMLLNKPEETYVNDNGVSASINF
ncbi:MAG: DUF3267 domain-containing protein [Bacteroidetes bacterium]|nr:DUF3267 domain-containing protein [Bacteroidota bacterium]